MGSGQYFFLPFHEKIGTNFTIPKKSEDFACSLQNIITIAETLS